jgi:hypothetical protein
VQHEAVHLDLHLPRPAHKFQAQREEGVDDECFVAAANGFGGVTTQSEIIQPRPWPASLAASVLRHAAHMPWLLVTSAARQVAGCDAGSKATAHDYSHDPHSLKVDRVVGPHKRQEGAHRVHRHHEYDAQNVPLHAEAPGRQCCT